jgi:hypothetical protein
MTFPRTIALAFLTACVSLAVFLLACSSSSKGFQGGGNDASADGAKGDGAGGGDGASAAPGVGFLNFSQLPDSGGNFTGGFALSSDTKLPADCTVVDAGACVTTTCPATDAGASDATAPVAPNPGTLTVTGGVFGTTGFQVSPDKEGTYVYASPSTVFKTGDSLGVAGAGGTVPMFSTETVVAVAPVTLTAPTAATGAKITIPTTADLTVTWTGGAAGAKMYFNGTAVFKTGVAGLACTWDASAGTATVPKAALVPMVAGNATGADVTWYQAAETSFSAGTWPVTLSAYTTQGSLAVFQ